MKNAKVKEQLLFPVLVAKEFTDDKNHFLAMINPVNVNSFLNEITSVLKQRKGKQSHRL